VSLLSLLAFGLLLNAAASLLVFWRGSLDAGGAAVGTVVGTLIFAFGGPLFWIVLMAFFLSSTAFGRVRRTQKELLAALHQKGDRRDLFQVLANGGMGMLTAVLFGLTNDPAWAAGFAVSFASSNSDTWGSELGVLSRGNPVSLLTFRPVSRGVSGGVSPLGCMVSFGGALFIALIFAVENLSLGIFPGGFLRLAAVITAGGFIGSLLDSLMGATLQAQYASEAGNRAESIGPAVMLTERSRGDDGTPRRLVRGLPFVNNDVVNFASCAVVTLAAVLLAPLLF
jgi:uncharacterized protein (TIGR00297 family)